MAKKKSLSRKPKEIPGLIKAISIIDYVYGIMLIIGAAFLFLGGTILASIGALRNLFPEQIIGGLVGAALVFAAIFLLALGVLYIYLGKAIKEYKFWAKVVQIILSIMGLFSFPIGTAVGIFVLWVLLIKKETKNLFS